MSRDPCEEIARQVLASRGVGASSAPSTTEIPDDAQIDILDSDGETRVADTDVWLAGGGAADDSPFVDDFTHLLQQKQESSVGPDGQPLDEFDQKWQHEELRHEEEKREAPYVRISPVSARRGVLGGHVLVQSGEQKQVAQWASDTETEVLPITVAFQSLTPPPSVIDGGPSSASFRSFGVIQWGARDSKMSAEVDILTGIQLCLNASFVSLSVAMEAIPASFVNQTKGQMELQASLGFYPISKNANVTRTKYVDSLGAGGNITFVVPPFSRAVTFWRAPQGSAFTIIFRQNDGSTAYSRLVPADTFIDFIPLGGNIQYVEILDGGGGVTGSLIFQLAF